MLRLLTTSENPGPKPRSSSALTQPRSPHMAPPLEAEEHSDISLQRAKHFAAH